MSDAPTPREAAFIVAIRESGLRLTHQRLEILRELAAAGDHPDAEELFRRVRRRVPTIALDTVYRTLSVLVCRGLVGQVTTPRATRFDPERTLHHHFFCGRCGGLQDVDATVVPLVVPATLSGIGDVRSAQLQLRGVCAACTASS